jgi:hypothetical protein
MQIVSPLCLNLVVHQSRGEKTLRRQDPAKYAIEYR